MSVFGGHVGIARRISRRFQCLRVIERIDKDPRCSGWLLTHGWSEQLKAIADWSDSWLSIGAPYFHALVAVRGAGVVFALAIPMG